MPSTKKSVDMVFLCQPNNPTGQVAESALMQKILEQCPSRGRVAGGGWSVFWIFPAGRKTVYDEGRAGGAEGGCFILKGPPSSTAWLDVRSSSYGLCVDRAAGAYAKRGSPWAVSSLAQGGRHRGIEQSDLCERDADNLEGTPYLMKECRALGLRVIAGRANYLLFRAAKTLGEEMEKRGVVLRGCGNYRASMIHGIERLCVRGRKRHSASNTEGGD